MNPQLDPERKKVIGSQQPAFGISFFATVSILCVIVATLYPFHFEQPGRLLNLPQYFHGFTFGGYTRCCVHLAILEPLANIALFTPFGIGVTGIFRSKGESWMTVFLRVAMLSICLSLTVEVLQVLQPDRSPSLADLLMNSIGGCVGFLIFRILGVIMRRQSRSLLGAFGVVDRHSR